MRNIYNFSPRIGKLLKSFNFGIKIFSPLVLLEKFHLLKKKHFHSMAKTDEMLINSILPHDSVSMNLEIKHGNYGKLLFTHCLYFQEEWMNEVTKWALGCHSAYQNSPSYTGLVFLTHVKAPTCHQLQGEHNSKQT